MDSDEKRLKQEDCNEDEIGTGVLTLTNKRIAFDKRKSRIADFTTKMGETVIDVPLDQVDVWKEGRFIKKICFKIKKDKDGKFSPIYKKHIVASGLVETYEKNLIEAVKKRDQIAIESFKYMQKKAEGLSF
jgi:hypothetical protein